MDFIIYIYIYIYIYVYICINTPGDAYICMHTYKHTTTRMYIYIHCPGLFRHLRKTIKQHGRVCGSVTVDFIPLWILSFLHMC